MPQMPCIESSYTLSSVWPHRVLPSSLPPSPMMMPSMLCSMLGRTITISTSSSLAPPPEPSSTASSGPPCCFGARMSHVRPSRFGPIASWGISSSVARSLDTAAISIITFASLLQTTYSNRS